MASRTTMGLSNIRRRHLSNCLGASKQSHADFTFVFTLRFMHYCLVCDEFTRCILYIPRVEYYNIWRYGEKCKVVKKLIVLTYYCN